MLNFQAIFIAHGPAFRKGYVSEPFANIELYNLMCGELRSQSLKSCLSSIHSTNYSGLLGITPSSNNGTAGSLYHLLTPSRLSSLPPPQALHETEKITGVSESCPYPTNEDTYNMRSFCEECVCWEECVNISNTTIDESNKLLDVSTETSKF